MADDYAEGANQEFKDALDNFELFAYPLPVLKHLKLSRGPRAWHRHSPGVPRRPVLLEQFTAHQITSHLLSTVVTVALSWPYVT